MHTTKFKRDRRRSGQRLPLPANPQPPDSICFPIEIPYDFANPQDSLWWIATFTGQLRRLGYRFEYQDGETDAAFKTAETWRRVVAEIHARSVAGVYCDDIDLPEEGEACFEVTAFHPAVSYSPNHPILTPDAAPVGPFGAAVWNTGAGYVFADGSDAMVNPLAYTSSLADILAYGAPSCRIEFSGAGELDIHFLSQPQGGWAWVFPDDNPLLGTVVNLSFANILDALSVEFLLTLLGLATGEQDAEVVHTMTFETTGAHSVTAWFLPSFDVEPPFLGAGGGLRKVQFCGEIEVETEVVMPYSINLDGCNIELLLDSVVVDAIDLTPCIKAIANPQLQDDGCQLQVYDLEADEYIDVPGANYYKTTAECVLTDTVQIEPPAAVDTYALVGRNVRNINDAAQDSVNLTTELRNSVGSMVRASRLMTRWKSRTSQWAVMLIAATVAGVETTIFELANSSAAILYADGTNVVDGLDIKRSGGSFFDGRHAARVFQGSQLLWDQLWNGGITQYRANNTSNAVALAYTLRAFPDGTTPANGFGVGLRFDAATSTGSNQIIGTLESKWAIATHATRSGELSLNARDFNGSAAVVRLSRDSGNTKLAFHGNAPITRQAVTGASEFEVLLSLKSAMHNIGLISDGSTLMADTTDLTDAQGDRNLPPTGVDNECLAANWVAGEIYAHVAAAYPLADGSAQGVFDYFRTQHGFDLEDLYVFANNIAAQASGDGVGVLLEINASYEDFVPAIYANLYDPDAVAEWAAAYGGYTGNTLAVLPWIIRAFSYPTWLELLYTGSLFGVENFDCSACAIDPPEYGEWAIEWTADDDWTSPSWGVGWQHEFDSGAGVMRLDTRLPITSTGNVEWWRVIVDIGYDFDHSRSLTTSLFNGSTSVTGPSLSMLDTESGIQVDFGDLSSLGFQSANGGYLDIRFTAGTPTPDLGEEFHITKIRIEGVLAIPDNTGENC